MSERNVPSDAASERPILVWTMRRSGSTSLARALSLLSSFGEVQEEPFNRNRAFGHVRRGYRARRLLGVALGGGWQRRAVEAVLASHPNVKHCYELHDRSLNRALLRAAERRGYTQLRLERHADVERILSLCLARETGVWMAEQARAREDEPKDGTHPLFDRRWALRELDRSLRARAALDALARGLREPLVALDFRELSAHDPERALAAVGIAARACGIPADRIVARAAELRALVARSDHGSRFELAHVPNAELVRAALEERVRRRTPSAAAPWT